MQRYGGHKGGDGGDLAGKSCGEKGGNEGGTARQSCGVIRGRRLGPLMRQYISCSTPRTSTCGGTPTCLLHLKLDHVAETAHELYLQ